MRAVELDAIRAPAHGTPRAERVAPRLAGGPGAPRAPAHGTPRAERVAQRLREETAGDRIVHVDERLRRALCDHPAAGRPRPGTQRDHVLGPADRALGP